MQPLVELIRLTPEERRELTARLETAGIRWTETSTTFLVRGALWVDEVQLSEAAEIYREYRKYADEKAKNAKSSSAAKSPEEIPLSYRLWLADPTRHPGKVFRLVLLLLMLWIFAWYPLHTVLKSFMK